MAISSRFLMRYLGRHAHAVPDIVVTLADDLEVDGENQGAAFCRRGALDQRTNIAAILHHIELKPERLADGGGDVLDRADRHRRQRVRNSRLLRRAAGQYLTVAVLHAGQPDRRQRQRQRCRLAQDRGLGAAAGDVMQDALAQPDAIEIGAVGAQRLLGIGPRLTVVDEGARHLAVISLPQIFDAGHRLCHDGHERFPGIAAGN